jgi:hypothetical protein
MLTGIGNDNSVAGFSDQSKNVKHGSSNTYSNIRDALSKELSTDQKGICWIDVIWCDEDRDPYMCFL